MSGAFVPFPTLKYDRPPTSTTRIAAATSGRLLNVTPMLILPMPWLKKRDDIEGPARKVRQVPKPKLFGQ